MDYVVDLPDLEKKLIANPDCRHVLISHMRGRVGDMDAVVALCERHGAILIEDCAHALGVHWRGKHTGHVGVACAISCQSYKMLNAGEGGFVLTNDPVIAAKTAIYAGAYEGYSQNHLALPPPEYFVNLAHQLPNYSLRMNNLAGAVLRPQIKTLDYRMEQYNERYHALVETLEARVGSYISIPKMTVGVTRMVRDSLQFNLDRRFKPAMVQAFLDDCHNHGLAVELFGHQSNARNFVNWKFAPTTDPLPLTRQMLSRACDIRLPLMWDDQDFDDLANVICESIENVVSEFSL
jgi:dTDP-4-amino-4,6-dideoxygalactose transaminase